MASAALRRMVAIAGPPQLVDGLLRRGVLVRHMVLPGCRHESMRIVDWLWEQFGNQIYLSLMNQYTPLYRAAEYPEINRRLTTFEYDSVVNHAFDRGFRQCFIQEGQTASEKFVPTFDGKGI